MGVTRLIIEDYKEDVYENIEIYCSSVISQLDIKNSASFLERCRDLYTDILDMVGYERLKEILGDVSSPRYVAMALIYLVANISRKEAYSVYSLAPSFGVGGSRLSKYVRILFCITINYSKYEGLFYLSSRLVIPQIYYEKIVIFYMKKIIKEVLTELEMISLGEFEEDLMIKLFTESIGGSFKDFQKKLHTKSPKDLATVICLIYLHVLKDINIKITEFVNCINSKICLRITASEIMRGYRKFLIGIYKIDRKSYVKKVSFYTREFLDVISTYFCKEFGNVVNKKGIIGKAIELFKISLRNGFKIFRTDKLKISYIFPQVTALSLIFYSIKTVDDFEQSVSSTILSDVFSRNKSVMKAEFSMDYITNTSLNPLYPHIKDALGRYKGQHFNRESFIKHLEDIYVNHNDHLEIKFFLELYKLTNNLPPTEYPKKMGFNGDLRSFLSNYFSKKIKIRYCKTIKNIKDFIRFSPYFANKESRSFALHLIDEIQAKRLTYNRTSFIAKLKNSIVKFYTLDLDFVLFLYMSSDPLLEPQEFVFRLGWVQRGILKDFIKKYADRSVSFRDINIFSRFNDYILDVKNILSVSNQKKALSLLATLKRLRKRNYTLNGLKYPFTWDKSRLAFLKDSFLKKVLRQFLEVVEDGKIPYHMFEGLDSLRSSSLYFKGSVGEPLSTDILKNYFSTLYMDITKISPLNNLVMQVFRNFSQNKLSSKPDHQPILFYILDHCKNALAIEVPVWKILKKLNSLTSKYKYYTGHIDLLLIENNSLIIADYKPDSEDFYKSIPQLVSYYIILEYILNNFGFKGVLKIKCIIFNRDRVIEFDPSKVKNLINKFIDFEKIKSKRKNDIMTKKNILPLKDAINLLYC